MHSQILCPCFFHARSGGYLQGHLQSNVAHRVVLLSDCFGKIMYMYTWMNFLQNACAFDALKTCYEEVKHKQNHCKQTTDDDLVLRYFSKESSVHWSAQAVSLELLWELLGIRNHLLLPTFCIQDSLWRLKCLKTIQNPFLSQHQEYKDTNQRIKLAHHLVLAVHSVKQRLGRKQRTPLSDYHIVKGGHTSRTT